MNPRDFARLLKESMVAKRKELMETLASGSLQDHAAYKEKTGRIRQIGDDIELVDATLKEIESK